MTYISFKNKEHIIREILGRLISEFDSLVSLDGSSQSGPDILATLIDAASKLIYTYRFIYIELASHLNRDDQFKKI